MSWEKRDLMSLKEQFLEKALSKRQPISILCREFGISRKTAYKWIERYNEEGLSGLHDRSKRPLRSPSRFSDEMVDLILKTRDKFKWGGRKLRHYLLNAGISNLPCEATFNRILSRHGYIEPEESEKRIPFIRFERAAPNELWQMDFKGHFKLMGAGNCHPLTVLDDHSRFSICLKGCASENRLAVQESLEAAFRTYGLPEAMTMDNGSPWKGSPPWRLSKLTVWLMRLGIRVSHSTPRHPQTQGKDERFHRSLKEEVLRFHQFYDMQEAQARFDEWREIYNNIRPHEGIGMLCPKDRYLPSPRRFPERLEPINYDQSDEVRKVGPCGTVTWRGQGIFLGEHLHGEHIGIRDIGDGKFDVYFSTTKIRRLDTKYQERPSNPFS